MFADEPTGNLDSRSGAGIMELLRRAARATGATIVVITHDEGIAAALPRRVALRDGRVEADTGAPRAVEAGGGGRHERGARARAGSRAADVLRTGSLGLRTRRLRAALSALGIAIGIASMVAVLGISESSKADLLAQLDRLGTNLLRVAPGQSFLGEEARLPDVGRADDRPRRGVEAVAAVRNLDGVTVRRNDLIDRVETGGIAVAAADPALAGDRRRAAALRALPRRRDRRATRRSCSAPVRPTSWGSTTPARACSSAGAGSPSSGSSSRSTLAPALDDTALVGFDAAARWFGAERDASTIYVRAAPDAIAGVRDLLGATANPQRPEEVEVSRPSDALEARAAAKTAFTSLFLGLGAVALLVGGVGIANVMVISVLERRSEVGLRRALGATPAPRRRAVPLRVAAARGRRRRWRASRSARSSRPATRRARAGRTVVPPAALAGGAAAALAIGAVAGCYPALRAARLAPTDALRGRLGGPLR